MVASHSAQLEFYCFPVPTQSFTFLLMMLHADAIYSDPDILFDTVGVDGTRRGIRTGRGTVLAELPLRHGCLEESFFHCVSPEQPAHGKQDARSRDCSCLPLKATYMDSCLCLRVASSIEDPAPEKEREREREREREIERPGSSRSGKPGDHLVCENAKQKTSGTPKITPMPPGQSSCSRARRRSLVIAFDRY